MILSLNCKPLFSKKEKKIKCKPLILLDFIFLMGQHALNLKYKIAWNLF